MQVYYFLNLLNCSLREAILTSRLPKHLRKHQPGRWNIRSWVPGDSIRDPFKWLLVRRLKRHFESPGIWFFMFLFLMFGNLKDLIQRLGRQTMKPTRRETNIVQMGHPPSQKEIHLPTIDFQGRNVSFREGTGMSMVLSTWIYNPIQVGCKSHK